MPKRTRPHIICPMCKDIAPERERSPADVDGFITITFRCVACFHEHTNVQKGRVRRGATRTKRRLHQPPLFI